MHTSLRYEISVKTNNYEYDDEYGLYEHEFKLFDDR